MNSYNKFENGVVILGAGNVATHLSLALKEAGFLIKCVYSKTIEAAKDLAHKVDAHYTNDINKIPVEADLYFIAVKDEIIKVIVENLNLKYGIVVHTAGSIPMDVFKGKLKNYGVFYPLQTFSKSREISFKEIPICIEANNELLEERLFELGSLLSKYVYKVSSDQRKYLHLAAVFACNFSNHMYSVANEIVKQSSLSFDILKPLIHETAQKAIDQGPLSAQTGPAVRNDEKVIQNHLDMLKNNPEFEKIYRFVSDNIYKLHSKK